MAATKQHAIAMHGKAALSPGFAHFPYVNANAPKGGRLNIGSQGTFDSLNPFIVKGVAPDGLRGLVYESLMARSADEPFTLYGLIANAVELAPDRASWITFHINDAAKFSDSRPITADDVIFSHDLLRRKGRPYLRSHYNKVANAEKLGPTTVKFHFKASNDREIPLIMGLMPILPRHATDAETFDQTSLTPPVGSGPYRVTKVATGDAIVFHRDPNYWAVDHPTRRGMHNFDELHMLYFRDASALFEAFRTGTVDIRRETSPTRWIEAYDFPAMRERRARQITFKTGKPAGMTGLVFNTRRKKFSDIRVRRAFALAFDGPAINKALFHNRLVRSESFFAGSNLASTGKPASALEKKLLEPFASTMPPAIMAGTWRTAKPTNIKSRRQNLKRAFELLQAVGYRLDKRKLIDAKSGRPFEVEFLVTTGAQERIALAYAASLRRLGVTPVIRKIEASQYWSRIGSFDFDMIQWHYSASLSPGNEQYNRWSSKAAVIERSLNFAGAQSPAVDAMIDELIKATAREEFVAAVRAYDRTLLAGDYLIPLFHLPEQWYAVWSHLHHPTKTPLLGTDFSTWWYGAKK